MLLIIALCATTLILIMGGVKHAHATPLLVAAGSQNVENIALVKRQFDDKTQVTIMSEMFDDTPEDAAQDVVSTKNITDIEPASGE